MLHIYDKDLNKLCIISNAVSIIWTKKFYDIGGFEIELPKNCAYLKYLQQGYYVYHDGNIGIIRYRYQNSETIMIKGKDLKEFLKIRCCSGTLSGNVENVIKTYVSENIIIPSDNNRKIPNVVNAKNQNRGSHITYISEYVNLLDTVKSIAVQHELGFDFIFDKDNKGFVFDVYTGTDRTTGQTTVAPVVFCKEFGNTSEMEYENDCLSDINTTYAIDTNTGAVEEYADKVYSGTDRKEEYFRANGDASTEYKRLLSENKAIETIETEANQKLKYKTDWFLGDYVTVKIKAFGDTMIFDKQITEVKEVYERLNKIVVPTFGSKGEIKILKL